MSTVTIPLGPTEVRCPICLDVFDWDETDLFTFRDGAYVPLDLSGVGDPVKRNDEMIGAYRRCPNPSADMAERHYLPISYASYGPPLVIGFIGRTESGKSHLLAAIVSEIERGGLGPLGFTAVPVDEEAHRAYWRQYVASLVDEGRAIEHTARVQSDAMVTFTDALVVSDGRRQRAVAFFDVAGDDLVARTRSMRFVLALDALIFVVDPEYALRQNAPSDGDATFETVMARLRAQPGLTDRLPVALAVSKSDLYRFEQPAARWYRRPSLSAYLDGRAEPTEIRDESRDAYAFLYARGARAWLRPFETFRRATLHFVSATGSKAVTDDRGDTFDKVFPRGVRPRRVLDPLAAIFAMSGLLGEDAAKEVGT
ncbi:MULTISPECIES: hypothetical protein [unclassified Parafrankia]|uniref:Double-GTPase 2 domain-containing protein n=1 Tax=Parafrankia soli TaxID=2599596 RepID=A0A1S1QVI5_9ACTN|nr:MULTISPECIES: hypothetical protein [unclassified Parafrankia]OHV37275.1 hypothetical protein BBK14_02530 [Parafrankia soli]TCJ36120.1 hypothetical protein E0504_24125 [Parafrankia sp. BMG5.11]CAI7977799.1 conserved hypothetical protein [Frankia sp. Hr75.2]SQD96362.1 conserved hypothetical protein [Parafrankia sp. Ea1.12]